MAEIRQGFQVHPPRGRSGRIRPSSADFALFSVLLAFMASFLLLVPFVRPGSLVWVWTIVIFGFFYSQIPFIVIYSVRLSISQRMIIGVFTVISWISFRGLFDREESFTVALSYLLASPELSGYTVRALQLAAGSALFLTSAALTRPATPPYDPSHQEPSTTEVPPPVQQQHICEPLPVLIRPKIFTRRPDPLLRPPPPPPRLILCYTEMPPPPDYCTRCSYRHQLDLAELRLGPFIGHTLYVRPPHVTSRRPRVGIWA